MAKLSEFTNQACAEAQSVAKHGRNSSTESGLSPNHPAPSPLRPARRMPDHDPPARKAVWAVASATSPAHVDVSSTQMSPLPLGFARRRSARSLPARSATQDELSSVGTLARASIAEYSVPPSPVVRPFPSVTDPAGVAAAPAFRNTGFCFDIGYRTAALGRNPVVPIVAGVPVVDPLV